MSRLVLQMGSSVDGKVSGGPGEVGGDALHPDLEARVLEWISQAEAHAMGRVTYEEMAGYWPISTEVLAGPMNALPKLVFSRSLERADWPETTVLRGELADELARLRARPGGDVIVYGGYRLAQALSGQDLVDEYRLLIRPVALGSGEPMFKDLPTGRRLDLAECTSYPDGTVVATYRRAS